MMANAIPRAKAKPICRMLPNPASGPVAVALMVKLATAAIPGKLYKSGKKARNGA
jgi:hypothetical protein